MSLDSDQFNCFGVCEPSTVPVHFSNEHYANIHFAKEFSPTRGGTFRQPVRGTFMPKFEGDISPTCEGTFCQHVRGTFRQPVREDVSPTIIYYYTNLENPNRLIERTRSVNIPCLMTRSLRTFYENHVV